MHFLRSGPNPSPTKTKSDLIAEIIRPMALAWTPESIQDMVASHSVPDVYLEGMARAVREYPDLVSVSDDEWIEGVYKVSPDCARVFGTPAGLSWMHDASSQLAAVLIGQILGIRNKRL